MTKSIVLLFASILVAVFVAEFAVRIVAPQNLSGSWLVQLPRGFQVNKSRGTARHQHGKYVVNYHFYPPHLRGTKLRKTPIRVLVLGDSFTFGWLLPWSQTYVHHLQIDADRAFGKNHIQFLNASTPDWGTADMLAYLQIYGTSLRPNVVLIFLNSDDIGRSIKRDIFRLKNKTGFVLEAHYPKQHVGLRAIMSKIPGYNWLLEHSELMQLMRNVYLDLFVYKKKAKSWKLGQYGVDIPYSPGLKVAPKEAQRLGQALFLKIKQWCIQHHATLLVTTTGFNRYYPIDSRDPTKEFLKTASGFFQKENIPYQDTSSKVIVRGHDQLVQIPGDSHPTAYEDHRISMFVWPWLQRQLMLSSCGFALSCHPVASFFRHPVA